MKKNKQVQTPTPIDSQTQTWGDLTLEQKLNYLFVNTDALLGRMGRIESTMLNHDHVGGKVVGQISFK